MKICKVCGEINEGGNLFCKNGDCLCKEFEEYDKAKNKSVNNFKKRERLKRIFEKSILLIYILILFIVGIINFKELRFIDVSMTILSGVTGVLCMKFTSFIFEIKHIFSLKDSSGENMSDMYDSYLKIVGILSLIYSIYILF